MKKYAYLCIMGKTAISVEEQIAMLKGRGMEITDEEKAKEVLLDVGYYRLGFYWFPFEKSYPILVHREHDFKEGANFDNAVKLYYFDFNLRSILLKYLSRVEINFRTIVTYVVSNAYKESPTWFVDPSVVDRKFISSFDSNVYTAKFRSKNRSIARHHKAHLNDRYAPAWKTIEFMTFGNVVTLYCSLNSEDLKKQIASNFNTNSVDVFENYLNVILDVRNVCAHGNILYDYRPSRQIRKGPALMEKVSLHQNLNGALKIVAYLVKQVSANRYNDLCEEIYQLIQKYDKNEVVKKVITEIGGIRQSDFEKQ